MPQKKATVDRLAAFSDGVFAVIITIMVLDLRPPEHPTFAALVPLWPTALSYVVSYAFIAIVWVNHHQLLRFVDYPTPRLIWINFGHLFAVSLVPFATVWVASSRLAAVPVFVYTGVFVLVELAYLQFEHLALANAECSYISYRTRRFARWRSGVAFGLFLTAMLVSLKLPYWGFGFVCCAVLLYLQPSPPGAADGDAD
ncbi:MAG TPA: TMEM175 family protein [Acidobacteriaceae bacterium]|nr:TMEM175 family protein [Acidobacteriaceae bacterium]